MKKYRVAVISAPIILFGIFIIIGFIDQALFIDTLWGLFLSIMRNAGFTLNIGCLIFLLFALIVPFTKLGSVRFGGKDAKPELTTWNYWAIALCAGIGTGIVFYGAVEPLQFAFEIPQNVSAEPGSIEAISFAMEKSYLHWTFTPYALYAICGLAIAYAVYNLKKPMTVSSGLVPLLGNKALSPKIAGIVDTITLIAIVGGVSGALGGGVLQIAKGLEFSFGIPSGPVVWALISLFIIVAYTLSSLSGLNKGIRFLSDKNAWIFIGFLLMVIVFGPTRYIFDLTTQTFGSYANDIVELSLFTSPGNTDDWPAWWDMYFLADWLAFAPVIGLFLARISYGRTVREFLLINMILPALFGVIWFGAFGGFVLDLQLSGTYDLYSFLKLEGMESLTLKIFEFLPLGSILQPIFILTIALSFITMADSLTSTMSLMSLKNSVNVKEAPSAIKIFWGVMIGLVSFIFIVNGGVDGTKVVMALSGFPILIIEFLMMLGVLKMLMGIRKKTLAKEEDTLQAALDEMNAELEAVQSESV